MLEVGVSIYPPAFETRINCSWLGGHPLANPEIAPDRGSRSVRVTRKFGSRKIREQDEFLARILRLVDNRVPSCSLGEVELDLSRGRHALVYLRRSDLVRIASEHPDIQADGLAKLPLILENGAVACDLGNSSKGYVGYIPEGQMEGYVVELEIEKSGASATCTDFRRQSIASIRRIMANNFQVRSQR